jgi:hypothetical protein
MEAFGTKASRVPLHAFPAFRVPGFPSGPRGRSGHFRIPPPAFRAVRRGRPEGSGSPGACRRVQVSGLFPEEDPRGLAAARRGGGPGGPINGGPEHDRPGSGAPEKTVSPAGVLDRGRQADGPASAQVSRKRTATAPADSRAVGRRTRLPGPPGYPGARGSQRSGQKKAPEGRSCPSHLSSEPWQGLRGGHGKEGLARHGRPGPNCLLV